MTDQEQKWQKDFEATVNYKGTIRFCNGIYADNRLHQKWIGYKAARKAAQVEIDQAKQERHKWYSDAHNKSIEIQQLKKQLEKYKGRNANQCDIIDDKNDLIDRQEKRITKLKALLSQAKPFIEIHQRATRSESQLEFFNQWLKETSEVLG